MANSIDLGLLKDDASYAAVIARLLWQDYDSFWEGLALIAREETRREVITSELRDWYAQLEKLIAAHPYGGMPKDD